VLVGASADAGIRHTLCAGTRGREVGDRTALDRNLNLDAEQVACA
jgi:hypothetical protein